MRAAVAAAQAQRQELVELAAAAQAAKTMHLQQPQLPEQSTRAAPVVADTTRPAPTVEAES
jgi:hypothetical protein